MIQSPDGPMIQFDLFPFLAFLVHVLDRGLVDHQVGCAHAIYLDACPVIPLNHAMDFLIIGQHDHHRRFRLHLLLVIEILCVGLIWRRGLARTVRPYWWSVGTLPPLTHTWARMVRA